MKTYTKEEQGLIRELADKLLDLIKASDVSDELGTVACIEAVAQIYLCHVAGTVVYEGKDAAEQSMKCANDVVSALTIALQNAVLNIPSRIRDMTIIKALNTMEEPEEEIGTIH